MQKLNDLSRSLAPLEPDGTLIAVIEMSQSNWLVQRASSTAGVRRVRWHEPDDARVSSPDL
jgi:transposase